MLKRKHSEMNAAERVTQLLKDHKVVIFSKSYCPFCVKVSEHFVVWIFVVIFYRFLLFKLVVNICFNLDNKHWKIQVIAFRVFNI
jgi:hypothetical protein